MILSKAGYGSIDLLMSYNPVKFLTLWYYERFVSDYKDEMIALNEKEVE